jgi:hypothetical protein
MATHMLLHNMGQIPIRDCSPILERKNGIVVGSGDGRSAGSSPMVSGTSAPTPTSSASASVADATRGTSATGGTTAAVSDLERAIQQSLAEQAAPAAHVQRDQPDDLCSNAALYGARF